MVALGEIIKKVLSVGGMAMLVGYPACSLMFRERNWRGRPKEEKIIFSLAIGGCFAVLFWILATWLKFSGEEYRAVIEGNEVYLTSGLLLLGAGFEVFLIAIRTSLRRSKAKKKKLR